MSGQNDQSDFQYSIQGSVEEQEYSDDQIQRFMTSQHQIYRERMKDKAMLASIFVSEKEFSFIAYERELMLHPNYFKITTNRFWTTSEAVARSIFRVLQRFIAIQCLAPVKPLPHRILKPMLKYIMKGKNILPAKDFQTLIDVTIFTYNFRQVQLSRDACLSLYQSLLIMAPVAEEQKQKLLSIVRKKIVKVGTIPGDFKRKRGDRSKQSNPTFYLNRIWNQEYEGQLVRQFRNNPDILVVGQYFYDKYPELSKILAPQSLKNRLRRVMRLCIRKLKHKIIPNASEQLPVLLYFNDSIDKNFQRSPGCIDIQVQLLKLWDNTFVKQDIIKLINEMNQFIEFINQERKEGKSVKGRVKGK